MVRTIIHRAITALTLPAQKQGDLESLLENNAQTNSRIKDIKSRSRDTSLQISEMTISYAVSIHIWAFKDAVTNYLKKLVLRLRNLHESLMEAEIRLIEAKSEFNALKAENSQILQQVEQKRVERDQRLQRQRALRVEYERMVKTAQKDLDSLSEEEQAAVREYRNLESLEALEQEVHAVDARLEMMIEGNPGAIKAYEKRKEDIQKTQGLLDEYAADVAETKEQIIEIRQQWEPELDTLISKISEAFAHNFRQIGCAGEVEVYKDEEDFDNWSIQISVRFR